MSGPTTDIEIMSLAAVLVGKNAFTTIDDADEFAVSVQQFYDMLVDSELGSNAWKFAKKQVQLSEVAGFDPDFAEYSHAYDLPADFLFLCRLYPNVNFEIFENRIYTSATGTLKIEYNANVPVTRWSPTFKKYIIYSLASCLAPANTEDPKLTQMMMQEREMARANCMWVDAQNSPNRAIQHNPWIDVRTGSINRHRGGGYGS